MSLLTIAQAASDQIGLDVRPLTIVGNPDKDAQRLLRFAKMVGSEIVGRAPWQALRIERKFTATATEFQANAIPASFIRFLPETLWDETNSLSITGPIGPAEYQARKNGTPNAGPMRWFERRGNALNIWPVPAAGAILSYVYQTGDYMRQVIAPAGFPVGGVLQNRAAWLVDDDEAAISEELITLGVVYRFLLADGQPYGQAQADYERRLAQEIAHENTGARVLATADIFSRGSARFTGEPGGGGGRYF